MEQLGGKRLSSVHHVHKHLHFYTRTTNRSLTSLRLIRVEVSRIRGLSRLRAQLRLVQCKRAITSLVYLFGECAADKAETDMPWPALEEVDCSSNSIRTLDRSLGLFPHVISLNFSDNGITEVSPQIRSLRALRELNLAHNQIVSLRPFMDTSVTTPYASPIAHHLDGRDGYKHVARFVTPLTAGAQQSLLARATCNCFVLLCFFCWPPPNTGALSS